MNDVNTTPESLHPLSQQLSKERKSAVDKRRNAGLDDIWDKARRQYKGVDENEGSTEGLTTLDGPVTLTGFNNQGGSNQSKVFDNITRTYTETGVSKVTDILLPTGKHPWDLKHTPVTESQLITEALEQNPELGQYMNPALAKKLQGSAEQTTEAAKQYIKDYLDECDFLGEIRETISQSGITGTGVLKGPIPKRRELSQEVEEFVESLPEEADIAYQLKYAPISKSIPVENLFPDPLCGTDIQNGAFTWERIPEVSKRMLESYAEQEAYFPEAIKECVKEGPKDHEGKSKNLNSPFEIWIRIGKIQQKQSPYHNQFVVVEMCNNRIIKVAQYPLEKETFPYDLLLWEPRDDSWAGIGVPERIETPQRGLNSSLRAIHDNMKWSVGFQFLFQEGIIEPYEGNDYNPTPYKKWRVIKDAFSSSVDPKEAMGVIEFPNYTQQLMPMATYWLQRAEQTANLPLVLQGQPSSESVGVTQAMQSNATTNLRKIVKSTDDKVLTPHINRYYEWSQIYGPESIKGDAKVIALGSSVLIVKELQQQILMQLLDKSLIRQFNLSPQRIMQAVLEGNQLEYEKLMLTEEERQELAQLEQQPEPPVQVAQIEAEWRKHDTDIDAMLKKMELALEAEKNQLNYEAAINKTEMDSLAKLATAPEPPVPPQGKPEEPKVPKEEPPDLDVETALKVMGLG
jgi:hypothetical protein